MGKKKVVFLDRDGVINEYSGTPILSPDDFRLLPGSAEAIRQLTDAGYEVVVISNQPQIGRDCSRKRPWARSPGR